MLQYLRDNITAAYLTDANGVPTAVDMLDWQGVSLLTGSTPAFQVPNTFAANQWSLATGSEPAQIVINISVLPANNGSPITAIQYRVGNSAWVTLPGAVTGAYPVTMAATSTAYDISLRAVNIVGPSAQSVAKAVTSGAPAATAPAAFGPAQWSLATGTEPASLTLNILSLPADGGSAITAVEYRVGSGEWVAFPNAETGPRSITMPQGSTSYSVTIRAVNAVNAGPAATAKTATSAAPAQQAPSVQTSPTISGSTTVGSILTRTAGTATGNPTPTRATVWLRNGEVIPGQTGNTLDTSGFAADDVITTRDDWTNSQGSASGASAPWTLTVQPSITATIDLQPAGQQSSITFNVAIDGSPTIAQGSTSITATRVGTTNQWTFTAPVEGPISFAATKAGYTAFSDATRTVAEADTGPDDPEPQPGIDSVVIIGASLENSMFGKSLTTAHSTATSLLAAKGHSLPVYGYATNGARMVDAAAHYNAARAAFPNALIVSGFGGGNITNLRPYASMSPAGREALLIDMAAFADAAAGDTRHYPISLSFRDYDDATFQNPANGAKPFNDELYIPWIAENWPHAMGQAGRPKIDNYRRVLLDFETWLQTDNIHLTSTGVTGDRQFIIDRIADILAGNVIPEIAERVSTPPPVTTEYPLTIINFTGDSFPSTARASYNNVSGNADPAIPTPVPSVRDVDGAETGMTLSLAYTGDPAIGSTAPGRGANNSGRIAGLPAYSGQLLSSNVVSANMYVTTGVTAVVTLTGAVANADYEIGMVGSRDASDVRNTSLTVQGVETIWNTSEATPIARYVTVKANAEGTITMVLKPAAGTSLAYLSGVSLKRIST